MSQLHQHRLAELVCIDEQEEQPTLPGSFVRHYCYQYSFGIVVGMQRYSNFPTQVLVLWSIQPHRFKIARDYHGGNPCGETLL